MALDSITTNLSSLKLDGDIARECLAVQDNFFSFMAEQTATTPAEAPSRFFYFREFDLYGFSLRIQLFNTAWLSRKHEKQGQLLFPVSQVTGLVTGLSPHDCCVTMLHHPYNWFQNDNARELRMLIEACSDIALTGHEHEPSTYVNERAGGAALQYVEGAVLQQSKQTSSGFSLLQIDTEERIYRVSEFRWKGGLYTSETGSWQPLRRNRDLASTGYPNTENFQKVLDDIGTGFTHPQVKHGLRREDVFVFPQLRRRSFQRKEGSDAAAIHVRSPDVVSSIYESRHSLISGTDLSGKSTLARSLYVGLRAKHDLLPTLISGRGLSATNPTEVRRVLDAAITEQYGARAIEPIRQLPSRAKALIIDDFDHAKLSAKGKSQFLEIARAAFDHIIIFTDDFFALEEISQPAGENRIAPDFESYDITEFGHYLRGKLIEKWVSLGRDRFISKTALDIEVTRYERLVETVLGRNLLPSHPITILTILQAAEASRARDTAMGSYGYLYETLILQALSVACFSPSETDVVMAFLSLAAFKLFVADQDYATPQDLENANGEYFKRYRVRLPQDALSRLVDARILQRVGDDYKFRYPYYVYFFVASYIRGNIGKPRETAQLRSLVQEMADHVHYEQYANTLAFYIYLSKDGEAIQTVVRNAKQIYDDLPSCDFDGETAFVNALYVKTARTSRLQLPKASAEENRDEYRHGMDQAAEDAGSDLVAMDRSSKVRYDKGLSDVVKINIANRTLQILGQVIRNSPGSLEADVKSAVASEAYMLGLRALTAVLRIPEENLEDLRQFIVEMIKEHRVVRKRSALLDHELAQMADERIIQLAQSMGYGMIRRISQAVGLSDLKETYLDILEDNKGNSAIKLIDVAIKLDHFPSPPEKDLRDLDKELKDNYYAHGVLRDLVLTFLYLRQVDHQVRSKLMSRFGIDAVANSKLLNNADKHRTRH
jgi:hypothetical protein